MAPKKLHFISGNKNKLEEVQSILGHVVEISNTPIDLPELQDTLENITLDKAKRAAEAVRGPVLVEDTSLCFKALNDLPGPYIKWFLESLGHEGLNKMLDGFDNRAAEAVSTFGYCEGPSHLPLLFQGRTEGNIVRPRGSLEFGWDPIFECSSTGETFGEMDKAAKNEISHRRKALDKLRSWLESEA